MALTQQEIAEYLDCKGTQCPRCKGPNVEGAGLEPTTGSTAEELVICLHCGARWVDVYALSGVTEAPADAD